VEFPCENIVRNILPAFKAFIVRELCYKYKYSQSEISKLLNITQASVSYYLHGARGDIGLKLIQTKEEIRERLTVLTEKIAKSATKPDGLLDDICELCGLIQQESPCNPRHGQKIEKI
jgi:predicted transcriptional regulator